jgi:hypothetical protein
VSVKTTGPVEAVDVRVDEAAPAPVPAPEPDSAASADRHHHRP